jgi:hypothetical protein
MVILPQAVFDSMPRADPLIKHAAATRLHWAIWATAEVDARTAAEGSCKSRCCFSGCVRTACDRQSGCRYRMYAR